MATVEDLIEMPAEQAIVCPLDENSAAIEDTPDDEEEDETDEAMIDIRQDVDVDDVEPLPPLTLAQAKEYAERMFEFVSLNREQVQIAGCTDQRDFLRDADALRDAIGSMHITNNTRQTSILSWMSRN